MRIGVLYPNNIAGSSRSNFAYSILILPVFISLMNYLKKESAFPRGLFAESDFAIWHLGTPRPSLFYLTIGVEVALL
jgi:hypothetical protein